MSGRATSSAGPVAVVLAAGKGERLGGPKALLAWPSPSPAPPPGAKAVAPATARPRELPLALAHAEQRLAAECPRVIVVARRPVVKELLVHARPGLDLVTSDAADELGPAGSIAVAASHLEDASVVLLIPVDTVPTRKATIAVLLEALRAVEPGTPAPLAVRPRHRGRGGHPVVCRREVLDRYRLPDPPPLREHLRALGDAVRDVEVDDAQVLVDLNTPRAVGEVLGRPPRFFGPGSPDPRP